MKYASIDIETTGLDPDNCQILEFVAIIDDTEMPGVPVEHLPTFRRVLKHPEIRGTIQAIAMNRDLFDFLDQIRSTDEQHAAGIIYPWELGLAFAEFLMDNGIDRFKTIAAGKNFQGFDLRFLRRMEQFFNIEDEISEDHFEINENLGFHHRSLDPCSFFVRPDDKEPPSLWTCCKRAGIEQRAAHVATEDARSVIELLRHIWSSGVLDADLSVEELVKQDLGQVINFAKAHDVEIRATWLPNSGGVDITECALHVRKK